MILLKQPIRIGSLELANRLVMPPMHTGKAPDGKVSDKMIDYYVQRAADGAVGLVIVEYCYVSPQGRATAVQLSLADGSVIDSHRRLTDAIHQAGSKVFAQINHAGGAAQEKITGMEAVAPSALRHPWTKGEAPLPRALTVPEIQQIEEDYAAAALRAQKAGYDGVEIHGAHAYLYNQFFSPLLNHREDEYGCGSVENRARVFTETIHRMREALGENFPIAVRFGGNDYTPGGSTLADCVEGSQLLVAAGCDLVDISGGINGTQNPNSNEPGYFQDTSRAVKEAVRVPVLLTGGVTQPQQAEALLEAGNADLIGVGRALLRDPDWGRKAMDAE